jgi:autoinducer 2-degrading protein
MHVVVVFLEAQRGREEDLRMALRTYARTCVEREPGCHRYDVGIDPVEGSAFLLYQVYEDNAAYLAHRELPHYGEFRLLVDSWIQTRRVLTYDSVLLTDDD